MQIPQNLPITPLQSKAARYQLGLTQANVIDESGLPGHKLKQFETGRLIPDMKFLASLRDFYEGKGIDLSTLNEGDGLVPVAAAAVASKPTSARAQSLPGMAFRIALPPDQIDEFLERMDANDERIDEILKAPAQAGFLSDYDETTEALQRELFGLMAANYLLFRALQGRSLISASARTSEKKTQFDLMNAWIQNADLAPLLSGDAGEPLEPDSEEDEE